VTPRSVAHARWVQHVNGVDPSPQMRGWLTDRVSLTAKLIACGRHFRVNRLRQKAGLCLADECAVLG
jgi:chorismate--pyruvate lyase